MLGMYWRGTSSGKTMCSSDRCAVVTHLSKQLCVLKESVMSFAAGTCVPQLGSQSLRSQLLRGVESDWRGSNGESRRKRNARVRGSPVFRLQVHTIRI